MSPLPRRVASITTALAGSSGASVAALAAAAVAVVTPFACAPPAPAAARVVKEWHFHVYFRLDSPEQIAAARELRVALVEAVRAVSWCTTHLATCPDVARQRPRHKAHPWRNVPLRSAISSWSATASTASCSPSCLSSPKLWCPASTSTPGGRTRKAHSKSGDHPINTAPSHLDSSDKLL